MAGRSMRQMGKIYVISFLEEKTTMKIVLLRTERNVKQCGPSVFFRFRAKLNVNCQKMAITWKNFK